MFDTEYHDPEQYPTVNPSKTHRAVCSCGWLGPWRAEQDAVATEEERAHECPIGESDVSLEC